jgi:REP element-mobilizing transposase RayT
VSEQSKSIGVRRRRRSKPTQERFVFPNGWGGRRKGSGPKRRGERANVSHRTRAALGERLPVEVTMRVQPGLPSLRGLREFEALRAAMVAGCERDGFRLIHFSVQSNHMHFIVEGDARSTLASGLQGLAIRMARALNHLWKRMGSVFADRYHDRILRSPREVWNALRYVLCNARKHGAWTSRTRHDPFSSAAWFDGWRGGPPKTEKPSPAAPARTWLLRSGWHVHGLIDIDATPLLALPRTQ